jgi:tetratricopeptide (TPR) repeat protein
MTEALITELGKVSALRVISRQSAMQFKGTDKPLPEISQALDVDAVVEGSVLREGDRVRISAQLVQAVPERHLWAESYERDLTDILTLQGVVAQAIAREVKIAVTPEEETRLTDARPVDPEAHRLYLLGRFYWNKRTVEALRKAFDYFEQAIAVDPDYALAYVGLADVHIQFEQEEAKGRAAAMKALEIDPLRGEAHASLGQIASWGWDWAGAEQHFRRATELSPNYAHAHLAYGFHLAQLGRFDEALNKAQRALELDPLSIVGNQAMGQTYYYMRDYEEAVNWLEKTTEMEPTQHWPHLYLCLAYLEMGRNQEAIEELRERDTAVNHPLALAAETRARAAMGKVDEAHKLIERIKEIGQRYEESGATFPSYSIAQGYVALGQLDHAFEWLERAYRERDWAMIRIGVDPAMDPVRDDPRFQDLLRRLDFTE